jgi:epoxyqueuosine reductase
MKEYLKEQIASSIMNKALELGASQAGICSLADLKQAPSYKLAPLLPALEMNDHEAEDNHHNPEVSVKLSPEAKSVLVISYAHPESEPQLDWWLDDINPPGNWILIDINRKLAAWISETLAIETKPLPYSVEKGGVFLKDAAVLAGLGSIGKNNLLITPKYGPRVRLRAMLLHETIPSTGPLDYQPCKNCSAPCMDGCPEMAFEETVYRPEDDGFDTLPGTAGNYDRNRCNIRMLTNISAAATEHLESDPAKPVKVIRYCRSCEISCPVGGVSPVI